MSTEGSFFLVFLVFVFLSSLGRRARDLRDVRAIRQRLWEIEAKVDALMKHAQIEVNPYGDAPPVVINALRQGNKIGAIKEYRQLSKASLAEAKDYVEALMRRTSNR